LPRCAQHQGGGYCRALQDYDTNVTIYDPWANSAIAKREYCVDILNALPQNKKFDSVILAVAHEIFKELNITSLLIEKYVIYDVKGMLSVEVDGRL
jgi:UDP-N-acetyl-D-galactosamine dehydrogenase